MGPLELVERMRVPCAYNAQGSRLGHFEAEIPRAIDNFRSIASKAFKAFPEILQLLPEIIGLLQELPGETPWSL